MGVIPPTGNTALIVSVCIVYFSAYRRVIGKQEGFSLSKEYLEGHFSRNMPLTLRLTNPDPGSLVPYTYTSINRDVHYGSLFVRHFGGLFLIVCHGADDIYYWVVYPLLTLYL